jgi:dipeptidyl aminopeptidase/acylaminoacyl peptidase
MLGLWVVASICWLALALQAQTAPPEYVTFLSHGKAVSCTVYDAHDAVATLIVLPGSGPSDLDVARSQAKFFSEHGFRVLLADYLGATDTAQPTPANYRRWAQVVEDIVAELHEHPLPRDRKIALIGQSLGATAALLASSHKPSADAIAEWSGQIPNQFFSQIQTLPPLLILHGEQDDEVPIMHARQLVRLCQLKDFVCDESLYPNEGHIFSDQTMDAANRRALAFFQTHLWSSLPKRAE